VYALLGALLIFGIMTLILLATSWFVIRRLSESWQKAVGESIIEISNEGIIQTGDIGRLETPSRNIRSIEETSNYFFVYTTWWLCYILPKRDLPSFDAILALKDKISGPPKN
jgi:hypothetical protein